MAALRYDGMLIWDPLQLGRLTHYAFDAVLRKYFTCLLCSEAEGNDG